MTGRFVDAEEALAIGMVTSLVEPALLLETAFTIAEQISANSPIGLQLTKHVVQTNVDASSLSAAVVVENRNQVLATRTEDMVEALSAFREKRPLASSAGEPGPADLVDTFRRRSGGPQTAVPSVYPRGPRRPSTATRHPHARSCIGCNNAHTAADNG